MTRLPAVRLLALGGLALAVHHPWCGPSALEAQEPAVMGGLVLDEATNLPVPDASVTVESLDLEVDTRDDGTFGFFEVPPGRISIRVQAPGRVVVVDEIEVLSGEVSFVRFVLPDLTAVLDGFRVGGAPDEGYSSTMTAAELLSQQLPGLRMLQPGTGDEGYAPWLKLRGSSSISSRSEPLFFLNGVRIGDLPRALDVLTQIRATEVRSIRVLRGPSAAFLHAMAADGAILIETKTGNEEFVPEEVEPAR